MMPSMTRFPSITDNDSSTVIVTDDERNPSGLFEPAFFDRKWITVKQVIGQGNFCQVHYGHLRSERTGKVRRIALKKVKESGDARTLNASGEEDSRLRDEYKLMKSMGYHTNVVKLMGCSVSFDGGFWILLELLPEGNLSQVLRKYASERRRVSTGSIMERTKFTFTPDQQQQQQQQYANNCTAFYRKLAGNSSSANADLTSSDLVGIGLQIARGMRFVSSRRVVHRDLAARNVLVDSHGVCKVADFGLSRYWDESAASNMGTEYNISSTTPLPIRWMAPEIFNRGIYSSKSDVWSFGVLLWEILTLGCTPYPTLETREVVRLVKTGYHPEISSDKMQTLRPPKVLWKCFRMEPSVRPDFADICTEIETHLVCQRLGGAGSPSVSPLPVDQYAVIPPDLGFKYGERV